MGMDGFWNLVIPTPMGDHDGTLTCQVDGATLTGTMTGPAGAMEIQNGTVEGDRATFTGEITSPMAMSFKVTVTATGDALDGEADMGSFGTSGFSGTRA
ncbi:MAG: hypothetical protein ABGY22_08480 [Acidimicrobiales bacterium]|nr:hypothetical protein [Acidimicrobiia bacterium]HIL49204.1 hypothetical protein [Acidimicrobiia bacterium]